MSRLVRFILRPQTAGRTELNIFQLFCISTNGAMDLLPAISLSFCVTMNATAYILTQHESEIAGNSIEPWGPPRVKVRGGGKGSWTESQIGMLPVVTLLCINKVKCH